MHTSGSLCFDNGPATGDTDRLAGDRFSLRHSWNYPPGTCQKDDRDCGIVFFDGRVIGIVPRWRVLLALRENQESYLCEAPQLEMVRLPFAFFPSFGKVVIND